MKRKKLVLTLSTLLFIATALIGFFLGALGSPPPSGGGNVSIWAVLCLLIGATPFAFIIGFYQGTKKHQREAMKNTRLKWVTVFFCMCLLAGTVLAIWKTYSGPYIYGIAVVIIAIGTIPFVQTVGVYRGINWQKHQTPFQQGRPKDA